jgi:hypothetical protein
MEKKTFHQPLFHVLPAFLARGVAPAGETAIQKRDEQGHPTASNGIQRHRKEWRICGNITSGALLRLDGALLCLFES